MGKLSQRRTQQGKVMRKKVIESAKEYITLLFENNCNGHDVAHTLRVYRNALTIAKSEEFCDMEVVALAALLHDVDDYKMFHTVNNQNAMLFLKKHDISASETEQIIDAINSVSFSKNKGRKPRTIEGKIVQDADRLDAMGAIGIARTFAYGGASNRSLADSIQHFSDKLLLLKDLMNTVKGRKMAEKRHIYMVNFLDEYSVETGEV